MASLDRAVLAERTIAVDRHLRRVADRLPVDPRDFTPATDASDAVILHLWQAVQVVIDLGLSACLHLRLGTPESYGDAFRRLAEAGVIDPELATRLQQAAGFRNLVAHAYDDLDMARIHQAAVEGPSDLRSFLASLRDQLSA